MTAVQVLVGIAMLAVLLTGTEAEQCAVSSNCPPSDCCVWPLVGRRKLLQMDYMCQAMPQIGQSCIVNESLVPGTRPEQPGIACPCPADTTCVPDGGYEVPQGPTGTCEINKRLKTMDIELPKRRQQTHEE